MACVPGRSTLSHVDLCRTGLPSCCFMDFFTGVQQCIVEFVHLAYHTSPLLLSASMLARTNTGVNSPALAIALCAKFISAVHPGHGRKTRQKCVSDQDDRNLVSDILVKFHVGYKET